MHFQCGPRGGSGSWERRRNYQRERNPKMKSGKPISFLFCIARIGAVFFGSCGDNLARILTIGVKESAYTQLIVHSLDA